MFCYKFDSCRLLHLSYEKENKMKKTIEMLEARINLLKQRGEMMNQGIINKIKREIRKRENERV